jgi:transcriptional regulator with XRE-family HTH domain
MVGTRLRELRDGRGLTLRELSAETGLSATLLSQIERGVTEPSLKSLRMLANVFGESVAKLFDDDTSLTVHVSKAGERSRIMSPKGQVQYERMGPSNGQLEVLRGVLRQGEASSEEQWGHPSVECAYVMRGTLTVSVGRTTYTVAEGDAITIDSRQPHRYANETSDTVEYILAVTPPTP